MPTLLNSLWTGTFENRLESAYQRYSHRQRQKSLIVVNGVDVALKIVTIILISVNYNSTIENHQDCSMDGFNRTSCIDSNANEDFPQYANNILIWTCCLIIVNAILCLISWFWRFVANNYLHWAALATCLLMNLQGNCHHTFILYQLSEKMLLIKSE